MEAENTPPRPDKREKLLLTEFWGLGDLTIATTILQAAVQRFEVTVAAKPSAEALLKPSYPEVRFIPFDPPWTAFRGKYRLSKWPWKALNAFTRRLRREQFDVAMSVRTDPRDHFLMYAAGARERIGFPTYSSSVFLTRPADRSDDHHKVEDWRSLGTCLGFPDMERFSPRLEAHAYESEKLERMFSPRNKPLIVLHPGARIPVRRWPEAYFLELIKRLRGMFAFDLAVVVEPDGYGKGLLGEAQSELSNLQIGELVHLMGKADLVICNDSGPGHIAAACGTPVCVIFGPGDPKAFRPWGNQHFVGVRDLCEYRPCFDYCRFDEPYCLTRLTPDIVWDDLQLYIERLLDAGSLRSNRRS